MNIGSLTYALADAVAALLAWPSVPRPSTARTTYVCETFSGSGASANVSWAMGLPLSWRGVV